MSRTRTVIARGVYEDKFGIAIIISVHGKPREFRKDEKGRRYDGWSREKLEKERDRILARERLKAEIEVVKDDNFALDVERYLTTINSPSHRRNAHGYLQHWIEAFGDRQRNDITEVEIKQRFAEIDKAASTKNHIRRELFVFYQTMNGKTGPNPVLSLKAVPERYLDARALPYDAIERIFAALKPSPSKARLQVMAYTGLPQTLIAKLRPTDLRLDQGIVYVRPRRKGAGVEGRELPLSKAGISALKELQRLNAFGPFQNRQLGHTFAHGIKVSGVTVPEGTRPYDLRHSFLTEVYRQTGDLKAVSELGMHATLEQTARYAKGAVSERATKAIAAVPRFRGRGSRADQRNSTETNGVTVHLSKRGKSRQKR